MWCKDEPIILAGGAGAEMREHLSGPAKQPGTAQRPPAMNSLDTDGPLRLQQSDA